MRTAECLKQLEGCEPRRVLRVTGIGRRGADSEAVRAYFARRYGAIESLLVANNLECKNMMGFMLMMDEHDVTRALADGQVHEVVPGGSVQVRSLEFRQERLT